MEDKIKAWLQSNGTYEEGVILYNEYGKNINLKRVFGRGNTPYTFEKLKHELSMLIITQEKQKVPGPETNAEDFVRNAPLALQRIDFESLPAELKKLHVEKGRLYQEAVHTHANMHHITTDAERFEYAKKIAKNFERIDWIWEQLDYYQEHKKMKPGITVEFDIEKATEADLLKHRNNLRSHISKLKDKPKRINDLLKKQEELARVEAKIKAA